MSAKESNAILDAYDFILRVRHALHFQSKRSTDLLALEKQPNIAWDIGYRREDIFERTKIFIKIIIAARKLFFACHSLSKGIYLSIKTEKYLIQNCYRVTLITQVAIYRWFLVINAKLYSKMTMCLKNNQSVLSVSFVTPSN